MPNFTRWATVILAIAAAWTISAQTASAQRSRDKVPAFMQQQSNNSSSQSSRSSSRSRNNQQATAAASAATNAKAAAAAKSKSAGASKTAAKTKVSTKGTTSTASKGKSATAPRSASGAPAGSTSFGASGQVKEITKSMAESVRPLRVDYDAQEMAETPGVIILNPRRYRPDLQGENVRGRTETSADLVRPL